MKEKTEKKKKKKSKFLVVLLCLVVVAFIALGNGSSTSGEKQTSVNVPTVEEQLLYEGNDVKITATGMESGLFGMELKLRIENSSSENVTIQARKASANGFMVDTIMSADVAAGKKANDSLTFSSSSLEECGIDEIANMEFSFHIINAESWDTIVDTGLITVSTSAESTYVQEVDDSGNVVLDMNGIKIIEKGLSTDDSIWGPGVILYIENNSDRDITVQVRDTSVNGFMIDPTISEDVVAGKKAMSAVQFFSSDLEENDITDITDVELYFHILDADSWQTVLDSDTIAMSF